MKKQIINILFLLGNILTISCQETPKNETVQKNKKEIQSIDDTVTLKKSDTMLNIEEIKKHIELQKRLETAELEFDDPYEYTEKDLELALKVIHIGLLNNGFKDITDHDFKLKMQKIFNYERKYSDKCAYNWYYLNDNNYNYILYGLSYKLDNEILTAERLKFGSFIEIGNYFFSKDYHFVTIIPYLKNLIQINPDNSYKIKLPQELISRNKYLFTDDKSQFPWLVTQDEFFMRSLVTEFGYTEDKRLLKWALENTHLPFFHTYAKDDDLEELGKLLWTKDCNGEIRVHQNTLDLLKEMSTPNENLYIMYVAEYLTNLEHLNANKELSDAQKAKIAAHLMYWGEQYKYDKLYDYNQMFMGHFWHYKDDGTYDKEFKKNNYYGLPKFKEWYEAVKKEENLFLDDQTIPDSPQPLDYKHKARPIRK
ncbi:hypothetical protein GYM73_05990 [Apibacter sp. ESL0432]|uniref:hypothetical protein n=1 Tax=Apibacter sp. ESL0432 TaxID=2704652 RepID=UPI001C69582D|nr:hypothetical protein [Apibacter sp. ESL0432]QYN49175.1 hypothetical protein GYM73_05990 [Apibacter sp. ESL0432]